MNINVDCFVNSNPPNMNLQHRFDEIFTPQAFGDAIMFDVLPREFSQGLDAEEMDDAFPVLVWHQAGQPVAWYDCETFAGFRESD